MEPSDDNDDQPQDPRLQEPGTRGMPGELIDTPQNLPGDQDPPGEGARPDDEDRSEDHQAEGRDRPDGS